MAKMTLPNQSSSPLGSTPSSSWTDAQLLGDAGEPAESFALFYQRHVEAVIRFAAAKGLPADTAADVVADTFLAALTGRALYRPEREHARLWLLTITSRRIADLHRRRSSERRRDQRLQSETLALTATDRDSYERLIQASDRTGLDALADLPRAQQQVVRARIIDEREYADIAETLGLSGPATRQHLSRGLAALRRQLKDRS